MKLDNYKIIVTQIVRLNTTPLFGGTPANAIMPFYQETCPTGWILANGESGTPDLRGIFSRGTGINSVLKDANGNYFNAGYGTYQNDSFQGHRHPQNHNWQTVNLRGSADQLFLWTGNYNTGDPVTDTSHRTPRTATETRPANVGVNYIIKY